MGKKFQRRFLGIAQPQNLFSNLLPQSKHLFCPFFNLLKIGLSILNWPLEGHTTYAYQINIENKYHDKKSYWFGQLKCSTIQVLIPKKLKVHVYFYMF